MKTLHRIKGIHFSQELDSFENGCDFESASSGFIPYNVEANTPQDAINHFCDFIGLNPRDCQLNACEEPGRVDCDRLEDKDGLEATSSQINQWKQDKLKLWNTCYSVFIEKITVEIERI